MAKSTAVDIANVYYWVAILTLAGGLVWSIWFRKESA